jgi:3-oxoacyl-[acyl-carrier-protein] synthase-3
MTGGDMQFLQMDGVHLFMFAMRVLGDSALRVIKNAGLSPGDIDLFIPHQANLRIIEAAAGRLNLPMEKTVLHLEHCGNTSAASIPIALHETVLSGRIRRGDRVVMTGFGAGLSWGSCLLGWHSDGRRHSPQKEK